MKRRLTLIAAASLAAAAITSTIAGAANSTHAFPEHITCWGKNQTSVSCAAFPRDGGYGFTISAKKIVIFDAKTGRTVFSGSQSTPKVDPIHEHIDVHPPAAFNYGPVSCGVDWNHPDGSEGQTAATFADVFCWLRNNTIKGYAVQIYHPCSGYPPSILDDREASDGNGNPAGMAGYHGGSLPRSISAACKHS